MQLVAQEHKKRGPKEKQQREKEASKQARKEDDVARDTETTTATKGGACFAAMQDWRSVGKGMQ